MLSALSLSVLLFLILVCPMFGEGTSKGSGILCFVDESCLGIKCNIPCTVDAKVEMLHVSVYATTDSKQVNIVVNGVGSVIDVDGWFCSVF